MIKGILVDEETYVKNVLELDYLGKIKLFDAVDKLMEEHQYLFNLVIRLRKTLHAAVTLGFNAVLLDAFDVVIEETISSLDCDRASLFMYDNDSE